MVPITMKKLPIAGIVSLLAFACVAATFNLSWEPSPTPGVSYRIYSLTNGGAPWKFERTTTNLTITLSNMPANIIAFGVTATNQNGESTKAAADVVFAPTNVRIVEQ